MENKSLNYNKNSHFSESSLTAAAAEDAAMAVEHTAVCQTDFLFISSCEAQQLIKSFVIPRDFPLESMLCCCCFFVCFVSVVVCVCVKHSSLSVSLAW